MIVREIECKSVLQDTGLPADHVINCYVGCGHACCYCYARYMKRFTGHKEPWGTFVDVRVNAPAVLEREVRRKQPGSVMLSSVCDGWQPLEKKHRVSGTCAAILVEHGWPVRILTKSALVRCDLDVLADAEDADIGVTLTAADEEVRRAIEPGASPTEERVRLLEEAAERGIGVWAFLGPFLPGLTDTEENINALMGRIAHLPLTHLHADRLNFRSGVAASVRETVTRRFPSLGEAYARLGRDAALDRAYEEELGALTRALAGKHGLSGLL
ncbi:MAG: radical SAM protein [Armatimonadota bacterium]|jgi:DNA repair photolyase